MRGQVEITREQVEHVARLAHLQLSPEEITYYQGQLGRILAYAQELETLKPQQPQASQGDLNSAYEREDKMEPSLAAEDIMAGAPRPAGTAFQVPRFVES